MKIKFEPVAWLTVAAIVVGGLIEADRELHVLPAPWAHWLAVAALVLGLVVAGVKARGAVTPVAAPRDDGGRPLVPLSAGRSNLRKHGPYGGE